MCITDMGQFPVTLERLQRLQLPTQRAQEPHTLSLAVLQAALTDTYLTHLEILG